MKKVIFILVGVLILGAVIGIIVHQVLVNKGATKTSPPSATPTVALPDPTAFQWGINTGPNALGDFTAENWQEQIDIMKKLGVKWVRFAWEYQAGNKVYIRENQVLQALWDNGINVILVIEPTGDWENMDTYQNGYNNALQISSYYKGEIKYYQLLNEGAAMIAKTPTSDGQSESDYDPAKYVKIKNFLLGAAEGIAEGDPAAKTVVTTVGTHTAYLDMLTRDKVPFDIIGLDWYSWSGSFADKKIANNQLESDKLKSYGKPMIFTEVNAWPAADPSNGGKMTKVNEDLQSSFISETAEYAYTHKDWIKGFYVFSLFDDPFSTNPLYLGIYGSEKNGKICVPTVAKKAYTAYQAIIKKYSE
ncbi:MAG: hypothetical protein ABSE91_03450 [Patescibacteria group bacterium]